MMPDTHSRLAPQAALLHRWMLTLACMVALVIVTFSFSAHAQIYGSVGNGCGNLLNVDNCPSTIEDGKIFSYFVCNMEKLIGEVFGDFYCQINKDFKAPMTAVVTLAIILFGVAFTIGVVQATAREFVIFLLKLAAIWGFATQADLLIGVAYTFFMGGLKEGIAIVVSGLFHPAGGGLGGGFTPSGSGGEQIYEYMDEIFKKFTNLATESAGARPESEGGGGGSGEFCDNALFAGLTLLALAFPPLFMFGVFLLIKFVIFFLKAVFGYIYAVLGISFLIVLAPIFLSFAFWKETKQYFDKWVGHLAAFALQMVIIFAFIAFVLSMDVSKIAKDLFDLIVPYDQSVEAPGVKWPWQVCSVCEFHVVDSAGAPTGGGAVPPGGSVKCNDDPGKPMDPASLMGPPGKEERDTLLKLASKVILTLLVLAYIVNALLEIVPQVARMIASAGGIVSPSLMSTKLPMEDQFNTFQQKMQERLGQGGNPITAYSDAFKEATAGLMVGTRDANGQMMPGLAQGITDFIADPLPGTGQVH